MNELLLIIIIYYELYAHQGDLVILSQEHCIHIDIQTNQY